MATNASEPWTTDRCCLCGEAATEDPELIVRVDGAVAGYLCNDEHAAGGVSPALSQMFVEWVRDRYPDRPVVVEMPSRGYSYTLDPAEGA